MPIEVLYEMLSETRVYSLSVKHSSLVLSLIVALPRYSITIRLKQTLI